MIEVRFRVCAAGVAGSRGRRSTETAEAGERRRHDPHRARPSAGDAAETLFGAPASIVGVISGRDLIAGRGIEHGRKPLEDGHARHGRPAVERETARARLGR